MLFNCEYVAEVIENPDSKPGLRQLKGERASDAESDMEQ